MEAIKNDGDKPRLGLVPPRAVIEIGKAMTYGSKKYDDYNYKKGAGLDWNRYYDALLRHLAAWLEGEEYDPESGLRHTSHAGACMSMLIDAVESGIGKDTRFKNRGEVTYRGTPKQKLPAYRMNTRLLTPTGDSLKCTYKGVRYDLSKPGYFPINLLKDYVKLGFLGDDSVCYPNEKSHVRYAIGTHLPTDDRMWFPGIHVDRASGSQAVIISRHKCVYGGKAYDISKPGWFPVEVLRAHLDARMIRENAECWSEENAGSRNTVAWAVRHHAGDHRVWFGGYSEEVRSYHHRYAARYRGKTYNIRVPGWFPAPVLKMFADRGMIPGRAVCASWTGKERPVSDTFGVSDDVNFRYDFADKRLWWGDRAYEMHGWLPRELLLYAYQHRVLPGSTTCWTVVGKHNMSLEYLWYLNKSRAYGIGEWAVEYFVYRTPRPDYSRIRKDAD